MLDKIIEKGDVLYIETSLKSSTGYYTVLSIENNPSCVKLILALVYRGFRIWSEKSFNEGLTLEQLKIVHSDYFNGAKNIIHYKKEQIETSIKIIRLF